MRKRLRSHEGANAVEFALVLPILLMLIFGAITAGLTLNTKQQLDHAAREGARYAATLPKDSPACADPDRGWHECVRDHVLATAVGMVNLTDGGVCVSYVPDGGPAESEYFGNVENDFGDQNSSRSCIEENPVLNGDRVHVRITRPARLDAVFVRTSLFDVVSKSLARHEK